jgi:photosystem II stability/assembly factor-like uncharacterized protein
VDAFNSIVYGNGKYVAVGTSITNKGRIAYSTDAENWTIAKIPTFWDPLGITLPADHPLNSVCYGNNRFVAVGQQGDIYSSTDGITWQKEEDNHINKNLNEITYNSTGGKFIAVGDNGTIITSTSGQNNSWTVRQSNTNKNLNGICWGTDRYLAVGQNGTILKSNNGEIWTVIPLEETTIILPNQQTFAFHPATANLTAISCIHGRYVITVDPASTNNVKVVLQSDDNGHSWEVKPVT